MNNTITDHINIWITAQTQKSMGRNRGIDNIHQHGVKRLRELILELAVQGKLVPQDPNDEPASVLLKKIAEEKKRLMKKQEVLSVVGKYEIPFDLPLGWAWVNLGKICVLENGDRSKNYPNKSFLVESGIPFINAGHLQNGRVNMKDMNFITKERFELLRSGKVKNGDILYCLRGSLGKTAIVKDIEQGAIASSLVIIRVFLNSLDEYLMNYFDSPFSMKIMRKYDNGTAQPNLSATDLAKFMIPLPPLAEQRRIVAKVDELMALCDKLEQQQTSSLETHQLLVETLLKTLTDAKDAAELNQAWQQIENNFGLLFTTEESVDLLKQTILQLAVMGKLTQEFRKQNPELVSGANSARELLKKIAAEKEKLIAEGKIKRQNPLPEITDDEKPFELPEGWEWCRPEDFSAKITDGEHFRPKTQDNGIYFLSAKDIREEGVSLAEPLFISKETAAIALQRCNPEKGDILIVSRGATVGRMCTVDIEEVFCLLGSVILLKPVDLISSEYLKVVMKAPYSFNQLVSASGSTAQPAIYLRDLKKIAFPVAPLSEQHHIIAKVDELFALCDALKERIDESQEIKVKLADAVVEMAVKDKPAGKVIYPVNEQLSFAAEPE